MQIPDDLGRTIELDGPAQRIVSLVPSITETLFALGTGDRLVGVTKYCIHPADGVRDKVKVGGTKTLHIEMIISLKPDLVIANAEENRKHQVKKIEEAGLAVFVNFTKTVQGCLKLIRDLGILTGSERTAGAIILSIQEAVKEAEARHLQPAPRVLCPIWKNPYMSINKDTFVDSVLSAAGGRNVFADHPERYPKFVLEGLLRKQPEIIILPTEPYHFVQADKTDFEALGLEVPAVRNKQIYIVEGELLSWYGPRVARALKELSSLLHSCRP